uniref:G_PROTEIN_RECEP_F1_2 domain-containing protein n=1 Tax=Caenorhabditis tropicalis TaxID=1561998 RepID=A0A1I7T6L2_9PELO
MAFFEDRYNRLVRRDADTISRKRKRILFYFINYSVVFGCSIPAFVGLPSDQESREIISRDFSCLPSSLFNRPRIFMLNKNAFVTAGTLFGYLMFCGCQAIYFVIRTSFYLYGIKSQSLRTSRLQKQLFKALCIQTAVPVLILIIPCIYIQISTALNYIDMILGNISMIWLLSHSMFSTITTLIVHKSYREAVIGMVKSRKPSTINSLHNSSIVKL